MTLALAAMLLVFIPAQAMKTPWSDKVDRKNPHPEYPRPTMVRKEWLNLNGAWRYQMGMEHAKPASEGEILVPFPVESKLSGVGKMLQSQHIVYSRSFELPKGLAGQRVLLHFGAVDWESVIYVNDKEVGRHQGSYDPFSFDITSFLKPGQIQTIAVRVTDPTDAGGQPRGKQVLKPEGIWYTPCSGIWQTVWLEPVPTQSIESYHAVPDLKSSGLRLTVKAPEGLQIEAEARLNGKVVAKAGFFSNKSYLLPIVKPKLWSPESPTLYDLKITLLKNGKKIDSVDSYFGMREMTLGKDKAGVVRLFLNGKAYFQYGPLDQGFWPDGIYTAPTEEALKFDIEAAKKLGCNMIRKHVKVEPERWYTLCDRMGMLVWQDMPSAFHKGEGDKAIFERELQAMIMARRNHPSIVMWVPFNEGWGQYDTERITELTRKWDPSRLINNPSGWTDKGVGDMHDIHAYPGPSCPPWEAKRARVLGEFGGLGLPLDGHVWVQKDNWGYVTYKNQKELTDAYVNLLNKTRDLIPMGLSAAVYTQTTDVEIEVNGWLTYDRKVWKIDPVRAAAAAKKLYGPIGSIQTVVPTLQTWKYSTENPGPKWHEAKFDDSAWKTGKASFGTSITPGAQVGTEWKTSDIWIRREYEFVGSLNGLKLLIHHDEDAEVYINGILAAKLPGYTSSYVLVDIPPRLLALLDAGSRSNRGVIAIHCRQTTGGQNIDCGFVRLVK